MLLKSRQFKHMTRPTILVSQSKPREIGFKSQLSVIAPRKISVACIFKKWLNLQWKCTDSSIHSCVTTAPNDAASSRLSTAQSLNLTDADISSNLLSTKMRICPLITTNAIPFSHLSANKKSKGKPARSQPGLSQGQDRGPTPKPRPLGMSRVGSSLIWRSKWSNYRSSCWTRSRRSLTTSSV